MTRKMYFDKAGKEDINALVELRVRYLTEDYGNMEESQENALRETLPDYYSRHLEKDLIVYTARESGEIVSCAFLLIIEKPSNPSFINGLIGNVLNVYTEPEYRNNGYAYQLMQNMLEDAKERKLDYIELKATEDGYCLYKKLGFEEVTSKYKNMKIMISCD